MLQQDEPSDYVIVTGKIHSVQDFVNLAFDYAGLDSKKYVKTDPRFYRPAEVDLLVGNAQKAKEKLGWESETDLEELVKFMVDYDIERLKKA